jgi:galactokinase/mevalonate kinase-like predicted kinase
VLFDESTLVLARQTDGPGEHALGDSNINDRFEILRGMKRLAAEARECLEQQAFDEFGELLHQGWEYKKQLASSMSNGQIDATYRAARRAGAIGGKISGAGGGGFLLTLPAPSGDVARSFSRILTDSSPCADLHPLYYRHGFVR